MHDWTHDSRRLGLSLTRSWWLAILLSAASTTASGGWRHATSNLEDYVGHGAAQDLLVDSKGIAWVGTQGGLVGYGVRREYESVINRSSPWRHDIVGVVEAESGKIVAISHSHGIFVKERTSSEFFEARIRHEDQLRQVRAFEIDEQGNLWIATASSVLVVNEAGITEKGLASSIIAGIKVTSSSFAVIPAQATCFGTATGVSCSTVTDINNVAFVKLYDTQEARECSDTVTAIQYIPERERIIAATERGSILVIDPRGFSPAVCINPKQTAGRKVTSILKVSGGYLISSETGLYHFDESFDDSEQIPTGRHRSISKLLEFSGLVWALGETGVASIRRSSFTVWPTSAKNFNVDVTALASMGPGEIVMGTYDSILRFEVGEASHRHFIRLGNHGIVDRGRITALIVRDSSFVIGTREDGVQVYSLRDSNTLLRTSSHLPETAITALAEFSGGIIIGTYQKGLYFLREGKIHSVKPPLWSETSDSPITSITQIFGEVDRVVVTTESGVQMLCDDSGLFVCARFSLPSDSMAPRYISSAVDRDGILWIGSLNAGLFRVTELRKGRLSSIQRSFINGLSRLSIYSIVPAADGTLWLSTNDGVWKVNPYAESAEKYSLVDGLMTTDFNHGASLINNAGMIFFGSPVGLLYFDMRQDDAKGPNTNIYLRSLRARSGDSHHKDTWLIPSGVQLPAIDNSITATVSVGELISSAEASFEYKLEGLHDRWVNQGNNAEISFNNLPPGDYVLRARGADSSGVWSSNEITLPITVLPPWWLSTPAYGFYALVIAALLFLFKRASQVGALRASRDELEVEVSLAQEREIDELQAHIEATARIAERSEARSLDMLACIDEFLASELEGGENGIAPAAVSKTADRIDALRLLQRFVSVNFDDSVVDLGSYTNALIDQLILGTSEDHTHIITINNVELEAVPSEHAVYLAAVMRELIENAFVHAFPWPKDGAVIAVRVDPISELGSERVGYVVSVDDNGIGPADFEAASGFSEGGLGLVNRIARRFDGTMEVDDIGGTRATVTLYFLAQRE